MPSSPPIVSVEIGSTKVRVLVGELREDGYLMITGIGEQPSRGVRKGEIIHFDNALSSFRAALEEAEAQSRVNINTAYLTVSGGDIQSLNNRGTLPILGPDYEITRDEIEHVQETARAVRLGPERDVLHTIQRHYYVNDVQRVVDPEGMEGSKLSLDMLIIHGLGNRLRNTVRVVKSADVEVEDVAFGGLCSALAVLTPQQKDAGALVINLGGGTTDYFSYSEKSVHRAGSIAVGGDHVTNDLALAFTIPTMQAERLKVEHGSAMVDLGNRNQVLHLSAEGGFSGRSVKRFDVQTVIHARMDETLGLIRQQLGAGDLKHMFGAGVVLTGGGARLNRLPSLVERVFGLRCTLGKPRNVSGLATVTEGPEFASTVGMLRFGLQTVRRSESSLPLAGFFKSIFRK